MPRSTIQRVQHWTESTVCVADAHLLRMHIFLAIVHEERALCFLLPAHDQAHRLPCPRADIHHRRRRFMSRVYGLLPCIHGWPSRDQMAGAKCLQGRTSRWRRRGTSILTVRARPTCLHALATVYVRSFCDHPGHRGCCTCFVVPVFWARKM